MKYRRSIMLAAALGVGLVTALGTTGCGHLQMLRQRGNITRPLAADFGTGPRASAAGAFTATLHAEQALRPRRLQTVRVAIIDAGGRPVEHATIEVDGGMPEHGHGLPTRPRVTGALGDGLYEIEGLRFNMDGWWELKLEIETPGAADVVTFNLELT